MERIIKYLFIALAFFIPFSVFATPTSVNRLNNDHIEPNIVTDFIQAPYFKATSTTASSTLANGINITAGCFAVGNVCLSTGASGTVGAGTTGQFPYYGGVGTVLTATSSLFLRPEGNIGVGTSSSIYKLSVNGGGYFGSPSSIRQAIIGDNNIAVGSSDFCSGVFRQNLTFAEWATGAGCGDKAFITQIGDGSASYVDLLNIDSGRGARIKFNGATTDFGSANGALTVDGTGTVEFNSGNVGIGTTSPYAALSVVGASGVVMGKFNATSTTQLSTVAGFLGIATTTNTGYRLTVDGTGGVAGSALFGGVSARNTIINDDDATGYAFRSSIGTQSVNLFNSVGGDSTFLAGNVGVGTSTPSKKLSVGGDIIGNNIIGSYFTSTSTTASSTLANGINLTSGCFAVGGICLTSGGGGSSQWTTNGNSIFYNTGNVGIGSTTPNDKLVVAGTTTVQNIVATSTTASSTFQSATINYGEVGLLQFDTNAGQITGLDLPVTSAAANNTVEAYDFSIDNNPILRVYSQSDGAGGIKNASVGVGTTSPWAMLSVQHPYNGANIPHFVVASSTANSTTTEFIVASNGFVGVGTSSPYAKLSVVGQVVAASYVGTTTATSTFAGGIVSPCFSTNGTSCIGGGGGSGTVNAGLAGQATYYDTDGTTVSGTSTLFITPAQRIGIGTTTPKSKLEVVSSTDAGNIAYFTNQNAGASALAGFAASNEAGNTPLASTFMYTLGVNYSSTGAYKQDGGVVGTRSNLSGGLSIIAEAGDMRLYTGSTERETILSTGQVGFGSSTPNSNLSVDSAATTTVFLTSSSVTKGTCLVMKDTDGVGVTYLTVNNGALSASLIDCR